jgi:DNA-binding MarR family transcriptional regulator
MKKTTSTVIIQELANTLIGFKRFHLNKDIKPEIRQSEFILLVTLTNLDKNLTGVKIKELKDYLKITPAAVTHLIDSLFKKNLVERLNDSQDRRIVLIKATKKGNNLVITKKNKFITKCEKLVQYLGEKDSQELIRLLNKTFSFLNNELPANE